MAWCFLSIGNRFFEVRRRAGETQSEFATKLGVSQSALVTYERNRRDPPASAMSALCQRYRVSPAWLLLGTGIPNRDDELDLFERAVRLSRDFHLKYSEAPNWEKQLALAKLFFQYLTENGEISDEMADTLGQKLAANE